MAAAPAPKDRSVEPGPAQDTADGSRAATPRAIRKPARSPAATKGYRSKRAARNSVSPRVMGDDLKHFIEDIALETLADEIGMTARDAVPRLPNAVLRFAPASALAEVLNDIAGWGQVCLLLTTADSIVEFCTTLPGGETAYKYFYWIGHGPLRGRLRRDRCGSIAFVERRFLGRLSTMVIVFDVHGDVMLKILPARGSDESLQAEQLKAMRALAQRVCRPKIVKAGKASSNHE